MIRTCVFLIFLLFLSKSSAQHVAVTDSSTQKIQEVDIVVKRPGFVQTNTQGRLYWDMSSLETMPHVLGSADPLRSLQLLPGVNTNNDYTSGLYIQGCSPSQSQIEMDGAPIFYPSHLLGLFSTFTTSHFRGMSLIQNRHDATSPNRVGGFVQFYPLDSLVTHPHLSSTVSFIQSEGTFSLPLSSKSTIYFSGRGSYLNLLYSNLLKADDLIMNYGLQDYNFTWQYNPNTSNKIRITTYYGQDHLKFIQNGMETENILKWYNALVSLNWLHYFPSCSLQQTAYHSRFQNSFNLNFGSYYSDMESSIAQSGYKIKIEGYAKNITWKAGADYNHTYFAPLSYHLSGSYLNKPYKAEKVYTHELSGYGYIEFELARRWRLNTGIRFSLYHHENLLTAHADPRITCTYLITPNHSLNWHYGRLHQYIRQIALSNGSFPIDYWTASNKTLQPQEAHSFSCDYLFRSQNGSFELSAGGYAKLLNGQDEMNNNVLDLLLQQNKIEDYLLPGKGINYGINLLLKREKGAFTGWIGYTLGYSIRKFERLENGKWFPSDQDRRHDLTIVGNYKLNKHWTFSGNFIYASGTPYTGTHHIYLINNTLISEYGMHNGNNLTPTHRLDLSATYYFKKRKGIQHSVNFSVYNVYAHKNELFRFLKYSNEGFQIKPVYSLCKALPSIGYSIKL